MALDVSQIISIVPKDQQKEFRHERFEILPRMRGTKGKTVRVDTSELALFREELKGHRMWKDYAAAPDSELVRLGILLGRIHVSPDIYVVDLAAMQTLVDEAVAINVGNVARALGGVASFNYQDKTISVTSPEVRQSRNIQRDPDFNPACIGNSLMAG